MTSWQLLISVIALSALILFLERPKSASTARKKIVTMIFVIILVVLLIASALSAFIYY